MRPISSRSAVSLFLFLCLAGVAVAQTEEAKKQFNSALELSKMKGSEKAAIDVYEGILKLDPAYYDVYINVGALYFKIEDFAKAEESFKKAVELKPTDTAALSNLGATYEKLRKFPIAEQTFLAAVKAEPKYLTGYRELGFLNYKQGKFKECAENLDKFTAGFPDDAVALTRKAQALQKDNNTAKAIEALNAAVTVKPSHAEAYRVLGQIYLGQEGYEMAIAAFQSATKHDAGDYRSWYNLAVAQESKFPDDLAANLAAWEHALKAARKSPKGKDLAIQAEQRLAELKKLKSAGGATGGG